MKLRNKKTGLIGDLIGSYNCCPYIAFSVDYHDGNPIKYEYDSLEAMFEDWEDYTPKEPLINLKIDNSQKLLIEEAVAMFASQDKLRGGYYIKQAQEILHILNNAELCGEG